MTAVAIVDSGVANLGSVRAAFARLGVEATVTREAGTLRAAQRVLLPGVGAYDPAMRALREAGLVDVLRTLERPLLGICLGMQLLFERSEEGGEPGLALMNGTVRKLRASNDARIPHMGWNRLRVVAQSPLLSAVDDGDYAYFVHSYGVEVDGRTLASCTHGERFAAVVGDGRVFGAQFHPERSAKTGARILENFLSLTA